MINRLTTILSRLCLALLFVTTSFAAESLVTEDKEPQNPERWFQIEVIVFQHSDLSDLKAEHWPDHITQRDFQGVIDFLSPIPAEKLPGSLPQFQNGTITDGTTAIAAPSETVPELLAPETEPPAEDTPTLGFELIESELPFLPLQNQFSTMEDKLNSIKRSRNYRFLKHLMWRQPVFDEKQAVSVRILGGDDFAQNFNADGTKIQKSSIFVEADQLLNEKTDNSEQNELNKLTPDDLINAQILEAQPLDADKFFDKLLTDDANTEEQFVPENDLLELNPPLPHVWELDGLITIHLRRYLHIKLDLEIKQLKEKLISSEQFNKFTDSQDFLNNTDQQTGFEINWQSANKTAPTTFVNPEDLSADTLKVEYLQPYPLIQQRRVRSTEVHYFDNPILGVLVLITPYDNLPEPEKEEESEFGSD
jgi:hypothetical protein